MKRSAVFAQLILLAVIGASVVMELSTKENPLLIQIKESIGADHNHNDYTYENILTSPEGNLEYAWRRNTRRSGSGRREILA